MVLISSHNQELDRETNFYFYNARYYDPEISRFTAADSIIDGEWDTQGWNRFSYVRSNPIRFKDPTGHEHIIMYYERPTYGNRLFKPAAETKRQELIDSGVSESKIRMVPFRKKADFIKKWESLDKKENVDSIHYFGHASRGALEVEGDSIKRKDILSLKKLKYKKGASIHLHGCNTAVGFGNKGERVKNVKQGATFSNIQTRGSAADLFANSQQVTTFGTVGKAIFSGVKNIAFPPMTLDTKDKVKNVKPIVPGIWLRAYNKGIGGKKTGAGGIVIPEKRIEPNRTLVK